MGKEGKVKERKEKDGKGREGKEVKAREEKKRKGERKYMIEMKGDETKLTGRKKENGKKMK